MCRVISCYVGKKCYEQCVALLHFVLQAQTCLLFRVSLDFLILHSNPLYEKDIICVCVLVLEGLEHHRTVQLQH